MLRILVPTDFSENADRALDYAVEVINHLGGHIVLYHTYEVKSTTGSFISIETYLKKDAHENLAQSIRRVESNLKRGASIEGKATRGRTVPLVCAVADKGNYDLIIMGTQGASGLKEIFIGSTTAGVIGRSATPVLAIPKGVSFRLPKRIVLALDSNAISGPAVTPLLLTLIEGFQARLSVFHLMKNEPALVGLDPSLGMYLGEIEYDIYEYLQKDGINSGINSFVAEINADLLCMIRHRRSFMDEIFHVSATRKEVFNSPVPLLILQD